MRKTVMAGQYALFLYLLLFIFTSLAQTPTQSITGYIKDNTSNETLIGANITVVGSNPLKGTITNEKGKFRLVHVPVGYVSLRVTYVGYQTVELDNIVLGSGKELILNIFMDEMAIKGEEVEIKATVDKTGSINRMTSVSARTFTVDETRRYAGSRNDVARMASNYAGVQTASDDRNDIVIRGNSPSGLLWQLEGHEVPNPNHFGSFGSSGGPVNMINNNQLANSDFLTAAFPGEYGNATSGVFDLRLRNGSSESYEFLGQIGLNGFELGAEGPISKKSGASFMASYRYSFMGLFQLLGMNFGTGTAVPLYQDYSFKVTLPTTKAGTFSIYSIGGWSEIEFLGSKIDTAEIDFYGGEGMDLRSGSSLLVFGVNHVINIGKTAFIKTGISYTFNDYYANIDSISELDKTLVPTYRSYFKENRLIISSFFKKRINNSNSIQAGINATMYHSNINDSVLNLDQGHFIENTNYIGNSWLIRPYVTWQHKFRENLVLNAGIHSLFYTFNSTYSIEPRLGIKWYVSPSSVLSFGYGLHAQLFPVLVYNQQTLMPDGTYSKMNEDLSMQKSHHFVLGYDLKISKFLRFKSEAYYQLLFNAGVNANISDSYSTINQGSAFYFYTPDTLESAGSGYNYGVELTIEQFLNKGLYYLGTVSLFQSKYKGSDGIDRNTAFNGNFIINALLGKSFQLNKKSTNPKTTKYQRFIGFDIKVSYAGGRRYVPIDEEQSKIENRPVYILDKAFEEQFPNYFRTDLKVYFKINMKKIDGEFAIDIQNLFNTQNIYSQNYNSSTDELYYTYQLGIYVIPQLRINF